MTLGRRNPLITLTAICAFALLAACGGKLGASDSECGENDFVCGSGDCVPIAQVCNGRDNCEDGSDEANCITKCENRSDYRCKDGDTCIGADDVCDGREDCPGGDDESTCATTSCEGFQCRDGACINADQKCDGQADCLLAEDEAAGTCSPTRCEETDYRCKDGRTCVKEDQVCDGSEQCPGGDDEDERRCPDGGGTDTDPGGDDGKPTGDDEGDTRPGGGDVPGKPGENSPDDGRPCVSIDEVGVCDGTVLVWCDNGQVEKRDCKREGKECGMSPDTANGNTCLATAETPPPPDECGDVTEAGSCDGDNLVFCSRGRVRVQHCARRGKTCMPEGNRFICGGTAQAEPDPCQGVPVEGVCQGDKLRHCKDGSVEEYDCAASGMSCDATAGGVGAECKASECGDITYEGECQGATLRFCLDDSRLIEVDCATDYGLECGFGDSDIGFICKAPESGDSCGDLTFEGTCEDTTVRWCENGQPFEADCADFDKTCGDIDFDGSTIQGCVADNGGCGDIDFLGECQGDTAVWCANGTLQSKDCTDGQACGLVSETVGYYCQDAPATSCEVDGVNVCGDLFGSDGVCHCDPACTTLGDCCDDYADICE